MGNRIVENYAAGLEPKDPRSIIQEWFESVVGDADHASTAEDAAWWEAQAEAYEAVLQLLTGRELT